MSAFRKDKWVFVEYVNFVMLVTHISVYYPHAVQLTVGESITIHR